MHPDRSSAPPLFGREAELAELRRAVGLEPGTTSAVVLGGDAGIGKTRLLRELMDHARHDGWRVMLGHCLDLGDTALPMQPFAEMFARLPGPDRERLASARPTLVPWLDPAAPRAGGSSVRGELFAGVADGLRALAVHAPVLVLVEDAHWADATTRHLVRFLLAQPFDEKVSIVVSYRADDLHRRHPLREALAEWARLPDVRRLDLAPLPDSAVAELVTARAPGSLDDQAVETLLRRAAGNAFFAEELADAGAGPGPGLPETLSDLLLVRLDRLDGTARAVVRAAACAVAPATEQLLGQVTGLSSSEVEAGLRAAIDRRVLVRGADGHGFRHALLAEAVREDLLGAERQRIHRAYLRALDETGDQIRPTAASIAAHALGALDLERAFTASVDAAREAMRLSGPDEAVRHLDQALQLAEHRPDGVALHPLVVEAVDDLVAAGRLAHALDLVEDHLQRLPEDTADDARARLLVAQATVAVLSSREDVADASSAAAVALAGDGATALRARALATRALALTHLGRDAEAIEIAEQGLAMAEQLALSDVVADVATTLIRSLSRTGVSDVDGARSRYRELIDRSRQDGHLHGELRGLHNLGFVLHAAGHLEEAEAVFRTAMQVAEKHRRPWAPYGFDGRFFASLTAYVRGRWDEAVDLTRLPAGAPRGAARSLQAIECLVLAGRGDDRDLPLATELRRHGGGDLGMLVHVTAARIEAHGRRGQVQEAEATHDEAATALAEVWRSPLHPSLLRQSALLVGAFVTAAPSLDQGVRRRLVERGADLARRAVEVRRAAALLGPEGVAWSSRLAAEVARLRWIAGIDPPDHGELVAAWRRALTDVEAAGEPYEIARVRTRLAAALGEGRSSEVVQLRRAARTTAERLGAAPLLAEIDAAVRAGGSQDLTAREIEVLAQVSEGLSNGQIGQRLFISTKTVSVHVSHVLAKLGAGSRTEAAAIARRRGLVP